jgi:hypothetical protein
MYASNSNSLVCKVDFGDGLSVSSGISCERMKVSYFTGLISSWRKRNGGRLANIYVYYRLRRAGS